MNPHPTRRRLLLALAVAGLPVILVLSAGTFGYWFGSTNLAGSPADAALPVLLACVALLVLHRRFTAVRARSHSQDQQRDQLRQLQQALDLSEEKYQHFANHFPHVICETDMEGRLTFCNDAAFKQFGYSREEFAGGISIFQTIAPHDHERAQRNMERILASGQSTGEEYTAVRKNGSTFPALVHTQPIIRQGRPVGLRGILLDYSNQRRAEEASRRFRAALNTSADSIFLIDRASMSFVDVNDTACSVLGYSRDELLDMGPAHIKPLCTAQELAATFDEVIAHPARTGAITTVHQRKDGTEFPVEINLSVQSSDQEHLLIAVARDVTERQQAERKSQKMQTCLQGISVLGQSLLAPRPLETKLQGITEEVVRLFGADFCRIWLIHPGDLCEKDCMHAQVAEGPHVCRYRDRCLHLVASAGRYTHLDGCAHRRVPFGAYKIGLVASGAEHKFLTNDVQHNPRVHNHDWARQLGLVSFAGYQLRVPGGATLGVLALFSQHALSPDEDAMLDGLGSTVAQVVQQAAAEKSLLLSKENLERANANLETSTAQAQRLARKATAASRAKSTFLANMSHEIRTPMNAILGFGDLLAQEGLTAQQSEYLDTIRYSGQALLNLINDILDFSKIEADKLNIHFVECRLANVVAGVDSLLRPLADEKQILFHVKARTPLPLVVKTDPARLRQCLINLINNAIKFTTKGRVDLLISLETIKTVPYIRFDVCDTGMGIPPEKQQVVFEAFAQADDSTTRKYGGTGLGLAIVKRLCHALGGDLILESVPAVGSVFSFALPVGLDNVPCVPNALQISRDPATPDNLTPGRRYHGRVLVVEDNQSNRRLLDIILKKSGLVPALANDGREALALLDKQEFDLILMDMQMPNMNGYEATRQLRRKGITTPVVALTAHAMKDDAQKCHTAGCNDYLAKPIERERLHRMMDKYLDNSFAGRSDQNAGVQATTSQNPACSDKAIPPEPLRSNLADDPDLHVVADLFLAELPDQIHAVQDAAQKQDLELLKTHLHALKGASGSAGFAPLMHKVAQLETLVRSQHLDSLDQQIQELSDLCQRALIPLGDHHENPDS